MPKTTITYRIFIASPSDIVEEKDIIKSVADELNTLNLIKNVKLEVIDWKSSTYPAIGKDAQDVINTQINDEYDIFIGIFWHNFGTATKRDISGTKEEFERAYGRYVDDPKSINILMYFKNTPVPISELDPTQIKNIQDFKADISNRGILFSSFMDVSDFEKILRLHLSQLLNEISNSVEETVNEISTDNKLIILEKTDKKDEELGYFEYLDIATKGMYDVAAELAKITKHTLGLESRMVKRTKGLNSLKNMPPQMVAKETRKMIDGTANDLDIFTRNVGPIIPLMRDEFNNSMNNFNKAVLIHKKYLDEKELSASLPAMIFFRDSIAGAHEQTSKLRDTISAFPPLTNKLLKSRREAAKVLTQITDELLSYINIVNNVIGVISE